MAQARVRRIPWFISALALTVALGGTGWAARTGTALVPTDAAPSHARGRAQVVVSPGRGGSKLLVLVHGLAARERFEITADGVRIGSLQTTRGGNGLALFSSRASIRGRLRPRLLGFDPRGVSLAVVNANGEEVLVGKLPGGSSERIACCITQNEASECARVTAALCASVGGTATEQSACAPDPCAPPPGDVVCCLPGSAEGAVVDGTIQCDANLAPAACVHAGGTVIHATSCTPNPCEPLPPPERARCCLPDGDGVVCEDRRPLDCVHAGGKPIRAESCDPNPCPPVQGACCLPSSAECAFLDRHRPSTCQDGLTPDACTSAGGSFVREAACSDHPCVAPPPVLVACCVPEDGDETECKLTTAARCARVHGTVSDATSCRPDPCEQDDDDEDGNGHGHGGKGGNKDHGYGHGGHGWPPWKR